MAILTVFLGMPSLVFYWIIRLKRETRALPEGNAMGLGELEERIQLAVERANEPLRQQISLLEKQVAALDSSRQIGPPHEEASLLTAHDVTAH